MQQLPTYRISLTPISDDESDTRLGLRSKLGGVPNWDQSDEVPNCPDCKRAMTFVGQIDSIHHDSKDNPHRIDCVSGKQLFMFGDVGLIYLFFCFDCLQPKAIFQCG